MLEQNSLEERIVDRVASAGCVGQLPVLLRSIDQVMPDLGSGLVRVELPGEIAGKEHLVHIQLPDRNPPVFQITFDLGRAQLRHDLLVVDRRNHQHQVGSLPGPSPAGRLDLPALGNFLFGYVKLVTQGFELPADEIQLLIEQALVRRLQLLRKLLSGR